MNTHNMTTRPDGMWRRINKRDYIRGVWKVQIQPTISTYFGGAYFFLENGVYYLYQKQAVIALFDSSEAPDSWKFGELRPTFSMSTHNQILSPGRWRLQGTVSTLVKNNSKLPKDSAYDHEKAWNFDFSSINGIECSRVDGPDAQPDEFKFGFNALLYTNSEYAWTIGGSSSAKLTIEITYASAYNQIYNKIIFLRDWRGRPVAFPYLG